MTQRQKLAKHQIKQRILGYLKWLAFVVVFSLSYTQDILYSENQNTKFLHGLARAGLGFLEEDWLAQTANPLPFFTWLVRFTYTYLGEFLFYVYFAVLLGIYLYSLFGIVSSIYDFRESNLKSLLFFTLFVAVHSSLAAFVVKKILGANILPNLYRGMAGQYVLEHYLQNCVFGVFLLLAVYLVLADKRYLSAFCIGVACLFHSAYLFGAGLLTVAFTVALFTKDRNIAKPLVFCILCLLLVSPILLKSVFLVSNDLPRIWEKALEITVHIRIPHHSLPSVWFDRGAVVQILIIVAAILLVRKTALSYIMVILFVLATSATVLQIVTRSDTLAMIAPWRLSAILVPLSTALLLGKLTSWSYTKFEILFERRKQLVSVSLCLVLGISLLSGLYFQYQIYRDFKSIKTMGVMNYVKEYKQKGQLYMVPPEEHDFDRFRLYTGAPLFVNWKSHPYQASEVVEWYERILAARQFYETNSLYGNNDQISELKENRITHIVGRTGGIADGLPEVFEPIYRDDFYTLFKIK